VNRVALVCEPPDGGAAEQVALLALGLPAHGYEATVYAPSGFGPADRLAAAGIELKPLGFRRELAAPHAHARVLASLAGELRSNRYALVHAHATKAGVLARVAAAMTDTRTVYTPHCFAFVGDTSTALRRFALTTERRLAPLTDAVVCVCRQERDLAVASGIRPRGRLTVVHNGVPVCGTVEPDPRLAALRRRGPVVGAVTVLRRQKRLDLLLDCAPRVLQAVPDARFAIVGGGREEERLRSRASRLGLDVSFVPFEWPSSRALGALDVYVLPSGWEALPLCLLEAQACGVPQVVTDVGGNGEAVTPDTGVVVAPGDPAALAEALVGLLRNPARRASMAAASRARHAERFSVERMVAETAAVYDRVLRKPLPRRPAQRKATRAGAAVEARDPALVRHPLP
jgi:glycosyltransferase involved in cell wall biosynthesis